MTDKEVLDVIESISAKNTNSFNSNIDNVLEKLNKIIDSLDGLNQIIDHLTNCFVRFHEECKKHENDISDEQQKDVQQASEKDRFDYYEYCCQQNRVSTEQEQMDYLKQSLPESEKKQD